MPGPEQTHLTHAVGGILRYQFYALPVPCPFPSVARILSSPTVSYRPRPFIPLQYLQKLWPSTPTM